MIEANGIPGTHRLRKCGEVFPGTLEMPDELLADYFSSYLRTYIGDIHNGGYSGHKPFPADSSVCFPRFPPRKQNANQLGRELDIDRTTALRWKPCAKHLPMGQDSRIFTKFSQADFREKQKAILETLDFCAPSREFSRRRCFHRTQWSDISLKRFIVMDIIKRISAWMQRPEPVPFPCVFWRGSGSDSWNTTESSINRNQAHSKPHDQRHRWNKAFKESFKGNPSVTEQSSAAHRRYSSSAPESGLFLWTL